MNNVLAAAVVVLALLSAVHLMLTLAMVRRLRELERHVAPGGMDSPSLPAPGAPARFTMSTVDGDRVADTDTAVVVVLSPDCGPCTTLAGRLVDDGLSAYEPLVIIAGPAGDPSADALVRQLAGHVRVAYDDGTVQALGVSGFPAVLLIGEGTVDAAGHQFDEVVQPLPVPSR